MTFTNSPHPPQIPPYAVLTHRKISEALGLSTATVTNILNQKPGLRYSEATRKRVLETAAKMGYQPNRPWQTIRRGRSNLIGIITVGSAQEVVRNTTDQLPLQINAAGYDYMVVDLQWHGGSIQRVIEELIRSRVEGVVISFMTENFGKEYVDMLIQAGIPVVAIHGDDRFEIPVVWSDIQSASFEMTQHLQDMGHRNLLMVAGSSAGHRPVRERVNGFKAAIQEKGEYLIANEADFSTLWTQVCNDPSEGHRGLVVHLDYKKYGHQSSKVLYAFCQQLFDMKRLPDALMCNNDSGAFGVFAAALEKGISIPGDMALTGFDNDEFGALPAFGLTTVHHHMEAACAKAIQILINSIQKKETPQPNVTLPAELVIRTSSGSHFKKVRA